MASSRKRKLDDTDDHQLQEPQPKKRKLTDYTEKESMTNDQSGNPNASYIDNLEQNVDSIILSPSKMKVDDAQPQTLTVKDNNIQSQASLNHPSISTKNEAISDSTSDDHIKQSIQSKTNQISPILNEGINDV